MFIAQDPQAGFKRAVRTAQARTKARAAAIAQSGPSVLLRSTPEEWLQRALCFFFWTNTVIGPLNWGFLDFLENYYFSKPHPEYLLDAFHSVALSQISIRTRDVPWLSLKAIEYRTRALQSLRRALADLHEARSDDVLISFYLIERSELIDVENQTWRVWHNHTAGISALLHLRGEGQFRTEIGRHLFRWINPQLMIKDMAYGSSLAYDASPYSVYARDSAVRTHKAALPLLQLSRKHRRTLELPVGSQQYRQGLKNLAHEVAEHDEILQQWPNKAFEPSTSKVKNFTHSGGATFPLTVNYFCSFSDAVQWNGYWFAKFRTTRLYLDCVSGLELESIMDPSLADKGALLDRLSTYGEELCSVIAYFLSQVDHPGEPQPPDPTQARGSFARASYALVGCNSIAGTPELEARTPNLRRWVMDCMLLVGNVYGLRQAHAFRRFAETQAKERRLPHHFMTKPGAW